MVHQRRQHFTSLTSMLGTEKCDAGAANFIVAGDFEDYDTSKMHVMKYADVGSLYALDTSTCTLTLVGGTGITGSGFPTGMVRNCNPPMSTCGPVSPRWTLRGTQTPQGPPQACTATPARRCTSWTQAAPTPQS
ncbi:hypothetical protein Pelo_19364 [Pelomyxa schiedti]|nr:hypothetical protein Pelo_19364 [Pelomyxa schiedti]